VNACAARTVACVAPSIAMKRRRQRRQKSATPAGRQPQRSPSPGLSIRSSRARLTQSRRSATSSLRYTCFRWGTVIQIALVALLIAAALKNWRNRETIEPPKWLGSLMRASVPKALVAGLLVILLGPSDIVVMLTVGTNLEHSNLPLSDALPFIGMTVLVAALPLLGFLIFHRRARRAMPKVRDWMNANSWLVNIAVCLIFIALIL
jgi:threonine/homoserine/homoserine lactone efflux protein